MKNNLEEIKKILMINFVNIVFEKDELGELIRKISLEVFNEPCNVYLDKIGVGKYILEVHFNDDNYYEIDISDTDTIEIFSENILNHFINERSIDKESIGENRNNVRYFRKYSQ